MRFIPSTIALFALAMTATSVFALPADEPVTGHDTAVESTPGHERVTTPDSDNDGGVGGARGEPRGRSGQRRADAPYERPRWPIVLDLRYGLPLTSQDEDVRSRWEHQIWTSYMGVVGAYWEFPRIIYGDWWFFTGAEFTYEHNEEQQSSGLGGATLSTDTMGFQLNGGLNWLPKFFDHKIGAQLAIGLPIWGQKSTSFDSSGFTYDLGDKQTMILDYALNIFYDIDHHWRPFVGFEYRISSNIALGLNYAF